MDITIKHIQDLITDEKIQKLFKKYSNDSDEEMKKLIREHREIGKMNRRMNQERREREHMGMEDINHSEPSDKEMMEAAKRLREMGERNRRMNQEKREHKEQEHMGMEDVNRVEKKVAKKPKKITQAKIDAIDKFIEFTIPRISDATMYLVANESSKPLNKETDKKMVEATNQFINDLHEWMIQEELLDIPEEFKQKIMKAVDSKIESLHRLYKDAKEDYIKTGKTREVKYNERLYHVMHENYKESAERRKREEEFKKSKKSKKPDIDDDIQNIIDNYDDMYIDKVLGESEVGKQMIPIIEKRKGMILPFLLFATPDLKKLFEKLYLHLHETMGVIPAFEKIYDILDQFIRYTNPDAEIVPFLHHGETYPIAIDYYSKALPTRLRTQIINDLKEEHKELKEVKEPAKPVKPSEVWRPRGDIVKEIMESKGLKFIDASKYVKDHGLYTPKPKGATAPKSAPKAAPKSPKAAKAAAAPSGEWRPRGDIVKKIMESKGLKFIDASKYVKDHGLYTPKPKGATAPKAAPVAPKASVLDPSVLKAHQKLMEDTDRSIESYKQRKSSSKPKYEISSSMLDLD